MSTRRVLTAFFALVLTAPAAQAATIDFSGNHYNMHTVAVGQTGTIDTNETSVKGFDALGVAYGYLPADSEITFSYEIFGGKNKTTLGNGARLYTYSDYDYTTHHVEYSGHSVDTATAPYNGFGASVGHIDGHHYHVTSPSLVLATADIEGTDFGTTTIINDSASKAYFYTALEELVRHFHGDLVVTYNVSAVPLPAALPMFAFALAAMGMLAYRRKMNS